MQRLIIALLSAVFAVASLPATLAEDALAVRDLLIYNPAQPEIDFNGDGKTDVADLVVALNASNSIYLRPDIRYDALQESVDFVSTLASMELSEKNAAIVTWLENHPLFDEVGLATDEVVWATFIDGLPIQFVDNRSRNEVLDPSPPGPLPPIPGVSDYNEEPTDTFPTEPFPTGYSPTLNLPINSVYFDSDLPDSRKVEIINAFGNGWQAQQTAEDLALDFVFHGYELGEVTLIGDANRTIDDLTRLGRCDVLYLGGHGGTGNFDDAPLIDGVTGSYFSVSTSDVVEFDELTTYDAMIKAKEIVTQINTSSDDNSGNAINDMYWAITENFIKSYVSFGDPGMPNRSSLIAVDACSSANATFVQACLDKGVSNYLGWTVPVGDGGAALSMDHFFGRLLGDDTRVAGANTNVRPFDIHAVFQEMKRLNLVNSGGSTLRAMFHENTEFSILRPMLHTVHVYPETEKLLLFGVFGSNLTGAGPGDPRYPVVTIDGNELNVSSWASFILECDLPSTGSRSIGEVLVTINGVESNPIPLTEFSGLADITRRGLNPYTQTVEDYMTATFTYRSRMSIHPFRVKPDLDPVWPWVSILSLPQDDPEQIKMFFRHGEALIINPGTFEEGGDLVYSIGGDISYNGCWGSVDGEGSVPSFPFDPGSSTIPPEDVFVGFCNFFTVPGEDEVQWRLGVTSSGIKGTFSPEPSCMQPPSEYEVNTSFSNADAEIVVNPQTFEIPSGSHTSVSGNHIIEWSAIGPCCEPPNPNLPN